ncbi:sulfatase-like hydrolase/transferase, partial [Bacteroides acidifaciens]|uniref:sulfatase-like hydrolase/transferase n=1 Tax=Bacteroides acidifaciens TaxID=85831 RepID=UPI0024309D13
MTETHLLNEGNHIFEKNEEADNTIIIFMSDNGEFVSESYRCGGGGGVVLKTNPHHKQKKTPQEKTQTKKKKIEKKKE